MSAASGVALVVGASSAIGRACAEALEEGGWRVAVSSSSGRAVGDWQTVACDVADGASVERAVAEVTSSVGPIDALVVNAGTTDDTLLLSMTEDRFTGVVDVNLVGAERLTAAVMPAMRERGGGRIVYMSSVAGITGSAGQANYAASKAGLIGLARARALEGAPDNVRVNVVAPGPVGDTGIIDALNDKQRDALLSAVPLGRLATPREVADVVAFLVSPAAAYVTGIVVPIDGGMTVAV